MSTVHGFAPPAANNYFAHLVHAVVSSVSAMFASLPAKASGVTDKTEILRAARECRAFSPNLANELNAIASRD
jgi:hypothetical protein